MGINILEKFFPAKTVITSATIKAEINYCEAGIADLQAQINPKLAAIATMTDAEHIKAEADIAATKRVVARLDARIARLQSELPAILDAENAAQKAEADAALRARAEAARKANERESKKLLGLYAEHANAITEIITKLKAIREETAEINAALRSNPVAEAIVGFDTIHRKTPDRQATERRETRPVWVHSGGKVEVARLDEAGNVIAADRIWNHMKQGYEDVRLDHREIVTERTTFRPGRYEDSLETAVHLPPAFVGPYIWPRS